MENTLTLSETSSSTRMPKNKIAQSIPAVKSKLGSPIHWIPLPLISHSTDRNHPFGHVEPK
jgi:hypothetical protein